MITIESSQLFLGMYYGLIGFVVLLPFGFLILLTNIFRSGFKDGKTFSVVASEHEPLLYFVLILFLIYLFTFISEFNIIRFV